jgi:enoyl-CoA hydratase/carnithine racemase
MGDAVYEEILFDIEDPIATITLNRPERLNALTARTQVEMRHALLQADKDPRVVGIILTGAGRAFSAGADMQDLGKIANSRRVEADPALAQLEREARPEVADPEFRGAWSFIPSLKKPVIAAINGPVAGMSFAITTMCDLRFASETAVLTTSFSQRGLVAEYGLSWTLPRLVGHAKALDLLWSARKIGAAEARDLGLVDRVFAPDELLSSTKAYLQELAVRCSPTSIMLMKRQVYLDLMRPLDRAMEEAMQLMAESLTRDDFREGVASFVEKREPKFPRV